jgi:hypothetical protein
MSTTYVESVRALRDELTQKMTSVLDLAATESRDLTKPEIKELKRLEYERGRYDDEVKRAERVAELEALAAE